MRRKKKRIGDQQASLGSQGRGGGGCVGKGAEKRKRQGGEKGGEKTRLSQRHRDSAHQPNSHLLESLTAGQKETKKRWRWGKSGGTGVSRTEESF